MQSPLPPSSRRKRGGLASLFVVVVLLAASVFLLLSRQLLYDTVKFWSYQPTSDVAALAERAALSDKGIFMFYVAHPEIDRQNSFNSHCERREQTTAILGCYVNDTIHIYDVNDKRLDGIKEVTAAHEMLHVVYQRLSRDEKATVNRLVETEYEKVKNDPAFAERMEFYARTEPGERSNELHSIIGTEIQDISRELETHYAKYFIDRSKILSLYNSYSGLFTTLASQAKMLIGQLESLGEQIETDSKKYHELVRQLSDDIASFNRRVATGEINSQAQFNTERAALQRRAEQVNQLRASTNEKVAQYEVIRKEYNETLSESQGLYQSIDSNLAPAPKV